MAPRRNAFTLTELLVVIAVISVLAAFLLPSLEESLEQSRRLACQSQLKQISLAQNAYATDCRGYFPSSYRTSHNSYSAYNSNAVESGWLVGLGYLPFEVTWCPNAETGCNVPGFGYRMEVFRNQWNTARAANPNFVAQQCAGYFFRFEGSWVPSNTLPLYRNYLHPTKDGRFSKIAVTWDHQGGWPFPATGKLWFYSHLNGYNVLYGDGSAMWLSDPGWSRSVGYDGSGPYWGSSRDVVVWNLLDRK